MLRFLAVPVSVALVGLLALTFASTNGSVAHSYVRGAPALGAKASEDDREASAAAAAAQLRRAPLNAYGYYVLGTGREEAAGGQPLVERAARINPRFIQARLWLALNHLSSGRMEDGIAEVAWLLNRRRSLAPQLLTVLGVASRDPRARAVAARSLANGDFILSLVQTASQAGVDARGLRELLQFTELTTIRDGVVTAQGLLVNKLIEERRFGEARKVWFELGGIRPTAHVFDGRFDGLPGGAPFGWTLINDENVAAAIRKQAGPNGSGALAVETFTSMRSPVAQQTLILEPGAYKLRFQAQDPSSATAEAGPFFWTVKCRDGKLLLESFVAPQPNWGERTYAFEVPRDCPLQTLALNRDSTTDTKPRQLLVTGVEVIR